MQELIDVPAVARYGWGMSTEPNQICHVARMSLPWRPAWQTECGLVIGQANVLTRAEWIAKVKREGEQRAAFSTCMTCWHTAGRRGHDHLGAEEASLKAIARELESYNKIGREVLKADFSAIAILIANHRAEFDELVEDYKATVRLPLKAIGRTQ